MAIYPRVWDRKSPCYCRRHTMVIWESEIEGRRRERVGMSKLWPYTWGYTGKPRWNIFNLESKLQVLQPCSRGNEVKLKLFHPPWRPTPPSYPQGDTEGFSCSTFNPRHNFTPRGTDLCLWGTSKAWVGSTMTMSLRKWAFSPAFSHSLPSKT